MGKFTFFQIFCFCALAFSGTVKSLVLKWITQQYAVGIDGIYHKFSHPLVLVWAVFLSKFLCGCIYWCFFYYYKYKGEGKEETSIMTQGTKDFSPLINLPPGLLDLVGTIFSITAYHLTYVSSLMMFRASQVIFTVLLSAFFLHRRYKVSELVGTITVFLGLILVGMTDFFYTKQDEEIPPIFVVVGDLCMTTSSALISTMVVYQQKVYFTNLNLPVMLAVGIEGIYGVIAMTIIVAGAFFWEVNETFGKNPRHLLDDVEDALIQMSNNIPLTIGVIAETLLNALYNFSQMSITKELSALTRQIMDNIKIITIWMLSVSILNERFIWQKVPGFVVLTYGLFLYNGLTMMGTAVKVPVNA